jgi:hypothetical protein
MPGPILPDFRQSLLGGSLGSRAAMLVANISALDVAAITAAAAAAAPLTSWLIARGTWRHERDARIYGDLREGLEAFSALLS